MPKPCSFPTWLRSYATGPHPEAAERLFQYLRQASVASVLVSSNALESVDPPAEKGLPVAWDLILRDLDVAASQMKAIFLR